MFRKLELETVSRERWYQFRLLSMELWLRLAVDGAHPETLAESLLGLAHAPNAARHA